MTPAFDIPSSYRGSQDWCLAVVAECHALDWQQGVVSYVVTYDNHPANMYSFELPRVAQFKHLRAMVATTIPFLDPETACLSAKFTITQPDGSSDSYVLAEDSHYETMLGSLGNEKAVITLSKISSPEGLPAMWLFKDGTVGSVETAEGEPQVATAQQTNGNTKKPGLFGRLRGCAGKVAIIGTTAIVGAVAAPVVATAALGAAGFSSAGVAAGSAAAAWQASIGNVAVGSLFAFLQSAGAGGAAAATFGSAAAATGAAVGTGAGVAVAMKTGGKKSQENDASGEAAAEGGPAKSGAAAPQPSGPAHVAASELSDVQLLDFLDSRGVDMPGKPGQALLQAASAVAAAEAALALPWCNTMADGRLLTAGQDVGTSAQEVAAVRLALTKKLTEEELMKELLSRCGASSSIMEAEGRVLGKRELAAALAKELLTACAASNTGETAALPCA